LRERAGGIVLGFFGRLVQGPGAGNFNTDLRELGLASQIFLSDELGSFRMCSDQGFAHNAKFSALEQRERGGFPKVDFDLKTMEITN